MCVYVSSIVGCIGIKHVIEVCAVGRTKIQYYPLGCHMQRQSRHLIVVRRVCVCVKHLCVLSRELGH